MKKTYLLQYKFSKSKGMYTKGWNICTLKVNLKKVSSCMGGGYDMKGTNLGNWIEKEFQEELKTLDPRKYYGMSYDEDGTVILNGSCGVISMELILNGLGYKINRLPNKGSNKFLDVSNDFEVTPI